MSASAVTVICGSSGEPLAVSSDTVVWVAPEIAVLEKDHPRRRFALTLAQLMQTGPDPEPYDPERAAYYARYILIPDRAFIGLRDQWADAELAECFNVPLEQIAAKQVDLTTRGLLTA